MIEVGILTPHAAAGADDELCVMAGKVLRTRVGRISLLPDGTAPTSPEELSAHAVPSVVDATAAELDPSCRRETSGDGSAAISPVPRSED